MSAGVKSEPESSVSVNAKAALSGIERTVKPRNRSVKCLPVVAICQDQTLSENGEIGSVEELIKKLPGMQPTLFAKQSAADFVAHLNSVYCLKDPNRWQWRASANERDICMPDGFRIASRVTTVIHFFGWKGGNYHKILDPVTMYGHRLDSVYPGNDTEIRKLLSWCVALRDFCAENGLEIRPTTGSLAAQFLTDKRFYPNPRRKVPAKTNESTREHLPGNHYQLNVYPSPKHEFTVHYLDQHRAHHYHARTVRLPDANTLYAHGRFTDLASITFQATWDDFYGLYCLDLEPPRLRSLRWFNGTDRVFVFSCELQHLQETGYKIGGVRAAWGSRHRDTGLRKYSQWCETQLDHYGDPRWLKQLLLSTYGILATTPRTRDSVFRLTIAGDPVTLRTGHRQLNGRHTQSRRKLEPAIANVLHRGMIEAATRSESIGLAQWLTSLGHRVLSIYADAVMVEVSELDLPPLPEPWRYKQQLNHLQFINQQAFISGELTKLPGVSRELLKYRQAHKGKAPRELVKWQAGTGKEIRVRIGQK